MNRRILLACFLVVAGFTAPLAAQNRRDTSNFEQRVIRLAHVEARSVARTVQGFCTEGKVAFDERTNTVVISAPPEEIEMALRLIGELDAQAPEQAGQSSAIIRVSRNAPDDFLELVHTLITPNTRASFDRRSGLLVLNGDTRDIQEVRTLIEAILKDSAPAVQTPLTVSFFFIQGLMGPENSPRLPPPQSTSASASDPRDAATSAKLDKSVPLNVTEMPFAEVLDQLTRAADLDAVVNWSDLDGVGIDRETSVSVTLRSPVPLRQALDLLFEQVSGEGEIAYLVRDGILRIATRDYLDQNVAVEVYDVAEFVNSAPRFAPGLTPAPADESDDRPAAGARANAPQVMWDEYDNESAERFMDIIRSTVTPDAWLDNGGSVASLQYANGMLVVKHNARGHEAVAELLDLLRARHAASRAAVSRIEPPAMLAPVVGALAENGFRQVVLLAPLKVTVGRNGEFSLEGSAAQFDRMLGVKVEGDARMIDAAIVELRVKATIGPKVALPGTLGGPEPMFRLESELAAPLGDYVVLATSPGATDYGQAIALVVRVDAAE